MPRMATEDSTSDQAKVRAMEFELQAGGCEKEPGKWEERAVATDQLGDAGTGLAMQNDAPRQQTVTTNSTISIDKAEENNESRNEGTTDEGGAKAMEVETPQKDTEEPVTNSAMKQVSTNTEVKQTTAATSPACAGRTTAKARPW